MHATPLPRTPPRIPLALALLLAVAGGRAATFTWTAPVAGNPSGSWTNSVNWTGAALPTTSTDTANFNAADLTTDATITLDGNQTINTLNFADPVTASAASWIISPGLPAGASLALAGTSPAIGVTSLGGGKAAVINAVVTGTNGLTKTGTAFLQLNAANLYSGGTILNGSDCRISLGNDRALGTGTVIVGATPGAGQVWLNCAGARTVTNNFEIRTIRWIIDNNAVNGVAAGDLTLNGHVLLNTGSSNVRDLYPNGRNLVINGNLSVTPADNPMNKSGGGVLTLNGTNTVGGASAVNAGTLAVNGIMNNLAAFTVASGATLRGTGVFSGPITVASGGSLRPNPDGSGALTCGSLNLNSGSVLTLGLAAPSAAGNGRLIVNGSLTLGGTLTLNTLAGFTNGTYPIITYSGALTLNSPSISGGPPGMTVVVDTATPGQVVLRALAGTLQPGSGDGVPMSLADPLEFKWVEASGAANYDLYLGTSSNAVAAANPGSAALYLGRTNLVSWPVATVQPNTTYFWRVDAVAANGSITAGPIYSFTTGNALMDLQPDTWVATDAVNRSLPGFAECGPPRPDRPVGIFYFLWHSANGLGADGPRDNTRVIAALGGYTDRLNPWADNPAWMSGGNGRSWYWGEPEYGYYANDDEWVIRRHIMLLEAAGVDVLGFDTTNGNPQNHAPKYLKLMAVIRKMQMEGVPVRLKVFHYTHGGTGGSPATVAWLYENFYKPGLYRDLWFMWEGKPLIVGYPNGLNGTDTPVSGEVLNFFTWRTGWAYVSTTLSNEWQWVDTPTRQNFGYSRRADVPEQMPVTCGGWANGNLGRSYQNGNQPGFDDYHLTTNRTEGLGLQFSEQAFQGLKVDPEFLWLTGWNEWWAGAWDSPSACYTRLLTMCCNPPNRYFVDNYNAEYSRDIEPMRGGFTDNYYYQMAGYNRQRKGVRPIPVASAPATINLAGDFSEWASVGPAFYDYPGETAARNWPATFSNLPNYTDNSGRNDFQLLKVARDASHLFFYAQCRTNVTSHTGSNWMVLFLNLDQSRTTGWEGYDYAVNLGTRDATHTSLSRCTGSNWNWTTIRSDLAWKVADNQLMLAIPRDALGLTNEPLTLDFHWADNFQTNDISGFFRYGDSAPERRFNYRYQTAAGTTNVLCADNFEAAPQPFWGTSLPGGRWNIRANGAYAGNCAVASPTNGTGSALLVASLDTSALESFRVSFRCKLANVGDAQNFTLEYFNGTNWISARELSRDQYHATGQAWSYDERTNAWLLAVDARRRNGTNHQFFRGDFALRLNATGLTASNQAVFIDDFLITGTTLPTNTAPIIAAISNRIVTAGTSLRLTNAASDADVPAQLLSWSLLAAPSNAVIGVSNGLFHWRPLIAQSPSTNLLSLRVTDNGSPPLSATQSFTITVTRPTAPVITATTIVSNTLVMVVTGDDGPDYHIFSSTNLTEWQPLEHFVSPALPLEFGQPLESSAPRKFYRLQLGP